MKLSSMFAYKSKNFKISNNWNISGYFMLYDRHTFLYESASRSFSLITFWLHQNIGAKGALKMLMKLTPVEPILPNFVYYSFPDLSC